MDYKQKLEYQSNYWYNDGLKKAQIRDLSGAIVSLKRSLQFNRENITARNLLGLVYYGRGEVAEALVEWIISKNFRASENIARNSRATDTFFKKTTAEGFYKIMQAMGVDIVFNHADYRLMSKTVLDALSEYKEVNLFLRGIVPLIGYKSDTVEYARKERFAGESKYPLKKMLAFAIDGITSFSIKPIRLITTLGVGALCASALMIIWFIIGAVRGNTVSGWATIVISIWLFGGLILLGLGVVGEYIGKIYMEAKGRPRFRVEKFLG